MAKIVLTDLCAPPSRIGRPRVPLTERLFKFRHIDGRHWLWTGFVSKGYGQICLWTSAGRTSVSVARVSAHLFLGLDLNDHSQVACHKNSCHNPLCFNPDCLYVGTYKTNIDDAVALGTATCPRGSRHYRARLNESQVRDIREAHGRGVSIGSLAKQYGVVWTNIEHIVKRTAWRHVA